MDVQASGDADQDLGEVGMDPPVASLVGVGEGRARDTPARAHVVELALLGAQAGLNVAQAFTIGELGEGHAEIPVETGEGLLLMRVAIANDAASKAVHGKVIDELGEDDLADKHGGHPPG